MVIGNQAIFMGAYAERVSDKMLPVNLPDMVNFNKKEIAIKLEEDVQGVKFSKPDYDTATVSEEARELYEKMVADTNKSLSAMYGTYAEKQKELQMRDPEDPFWGSTGNQWLVFSEYLYNNGFYDEMSDEQVKSIEQILDKITGAMDRFGRMSYGVNMNINAVPGEVVDGFDSLTESGALWTNLESSTAALRLFGEKMIEDEELRKEFNGLVNQYYEHNARTLVRYRSPTETVSQLREGNYSYAAFLEACDQRMKEILEQMEEESIEAFKNVGNANSTHTVTEQEAYVKELQEIFEQLKQGIAD